MVCNAIAYTVIAMCVLFLVVSLFSARSRKIPPSPSLILFSVAPIIVLLFGAVEFDNGEGKWSLNGRLCRYGDVPEPTDTVEPSEVSVGSKCPIASLVDKVRVSFHKTRADDAKKLAAELSRCNIAFEIEQGVASNIGGYDRPKTGDNRVAFNSKGVKAAADPAFQSLIANAVGETEFDTTTNTSEKAKKGSVQVNLFGPPQKG